MRLELKNILRLTILNMVLLWTCNGLAHASDSNLQSDTSKVIEKPNYSVNKSRTTSKMNQLAEESDKLINNVKVFYNPISTQISVNFKLNKESNIIIKVMDALGNEVLNLHNASLSAGVQNLNFDTQQKLSEGFYFVRLSGGTETVVKRISVR